MISDERSEVAERLRELPSTADADGCCTVWDIMFALGVKAGDVIGFVPADNAMRLADLIDPTCEVDSIEPVEYGEFNETIGYVFNLTCGHQVICPYAEMPPTYCSKCGKRVVKTND